MTDQTFREKVPGHDAVYVLRDLFRVIILGFVVWTGTTLRNLDNVVTLSVYRLQQVETRLESSVRRLREIERQIETKETEND
jgi:hypothetical protein